MTTGRFALAHRATRTAKGNSFSFLLALRTATRAPHSRVRGRQRVPSPMLPSTRPPPPERVSYRRMEPALPVKYMVWVLLQTLPSASTTIRLGVLQVAADFVQDKITKTEVLSPFKQDIVPHPTPHPRQPRCNHRRRRRFAFSTTRPRHAADSWADSSCREACFQTRAQGFGRTVPLHPPRPSRRAPRIC